MTYSPSAELDQKIQDIMADEIQSVKGASGFFPNLVIQPLYEGAIRAGKQRGGSAGGTEADGPLTGMPRGPGPPSRNKTPDSNNL